MVRNHSTERAADARRVLNESIASDDSDNQPSTSRITRQNPQPPKPTTSRSRKQAQPQKAQRNQQEAPLLREIKRLQIGTENLIPRAPFGRLLKEIIDTHGHYRMTKDAFDCLQEASEVYLVQLFEDAYKLTLHRKRVTLNPADLLLLITIRGINDPGYGSRL